MIEDDSSLLTPLTIDEPERKETAQMKKQPESTTDMILEGETLISQVPPLLGTTPSENTQIQHRNTPEDISDILGTRVYKRYVDTPLQTLDGIIINQPTISYHSLRKPRELPKKLELKNSMNSGLGYPENNY